MSNTAASAFVSADKVSEFYNRFICPEGESPKDQVKVSQSDGKASDAEDQRLLDVMFLKFPGSEALWRGDISKYEGDDSRADLALCSSLVKVCHADLNRADELFRQSALMRDKWDGKRGSTTYGRMTLEKALEGYDPDKAPRLTLPIASLVPVADDGEDSLSMGVSELTDWLQDQKLTDSDITDQVLAAMFARRYRDVLAFVPEAKCMYAFDGARWVKAGAEQQAERMMKSFMDAATYCCMRVSNDKERSELLKRMSRYHQYRPRKNVLEDAKSELVVPLSRFDQNPNLLNVLNKTIDFSGSEPIVRDHDASDLITYLAPVEYDPHTGCELFVETLMQCVEGDAELAEFIQKIYGKVLASDTSDDAFFLWGEAPRSGKGTITAPLAEMLGTGEGGYAKNAQPETFAVARNRNSSSSSGDRARLRGAKLILASEPRQGLELDASFMKELTGDDLVTARFNYHDDEQFRMIGVMFMLANTFPTIDDPSVFGSDRVVVIPFERHLAKDERDLTLRGRLRDPAMLSGLLNWCIEGYRKVKADGFEKPDAVTDAIHEYEARCDVVALYIRMRLVACEGCLLKASDLMTDFTAWATRTHHTSLGRNELYSRLRQHVIWRQRATVEGRSERNVVEGYTFLAAD